MTFAIKKLSVNKKRNTEPTLNSENIVKMAKMMEHKPKPEANELIMSKRTLDITRIQDLNGNLS